MQRDGFDAEPGAAVENPPLRFPHPPAEGVGTVEVEAFAVGGVGVEKPQAVTLLFPDQEFEVFGRFEQPFALGAGQSQIGEAKPGEPLKMDGLLFFREVTRAEKVGKWKMIE